jgi:tetratricopeptide (TPR) repeat protein
MGRKQRRRRKHLYFFLAGNIIALILICGCTHFYEGFVVKPDFKEADDLVKTGNYNGSLLKYEQIMVQYPRVGYRALFEMGLIYASSQNQQKDYQKSLNCFQKLIKDYPKSRYKQSSEVIISLINDVIDKEKNAIMQQKKITQYGHKVNECERKVNECENKLINCEHKVNECEKKIEQMKTIDMNLIHKKKPFH